MVFSRFTFLVIIVIVAWLPTKTLAVEYGGIGGRPAYFDPNNPRTKSIFVFTLEPGQSAESGIRVINNTDEEKTLMVYAVDSVVSSGGAFACGQFNDEKKDVGSWIELSKEEVTLGSLSSEVVPFTITLPQTVDVGEHNGCIVIQEKKSPASKERKEGITLTFRTGLRVAVLVPGEIKRKLEIAGFSFVKQTDGSYLARPRVRNLGNVSVDADVNVLVDYFFGSNWAVKGGQYPVLREEESEWNFKIEKPFWGGWYKAYLVVKYDPHLEAGVGTFSGKGFEILTSPAITFFVFPHPLALLIELMVLVVAILLIFRCWIWYRRRCWIKNSWIEYEVKEGEDLKLLADKFNISWKLLAKTNGIKPPYTLEKGSKIKVPPRS